MTEIPNRQRPTHKPGSVGTVWTAEQAAAFLTATAEDRLGARYGLALDSGPGATASWSVLMLPRARRRAELGAAWICTR